MSVEVGSIGGGVGGVAGAASVSGAAIFRMPPLEAAPVVVNAGLVRSLEGFRPMNASDINTIDFKGGTVAPSASSQPLVIQQAEAVAAAALEKSELIPQQEVVLPVVLPGAEPLDIPQVEQRVIPVILPITSTIVEDNAFLAGLSPKTGTKVLGRVSPSIAPQPLVQEQEEEEVLEKVEQVAPEDSLEEEEITEKRFFLEDEKALAVRKFEIKQAIKLVKLSTIVGSVVARFLPGEHEGNRSSALKGKGPDGSYEETVEAIATSGEFNSSEQAEKRFEEIVDEKKPIKNSKEGSPVADSDVARVFKFRAVKPSAAVEIYTRRIVKKQAQVAVGQGVAPKTGINEIPLEELSQELAEVFEKAA